MTKFKLLLVPAVIIGALFAMYIVSVPLDTINRADIAFCLMGLVAAVHAYMAFQWYQRGYMTFKHMQMHQDATSFIIDKIINDLIPKDEQEAYMKKLTDEQVAEVMKKVGAIMPDHDESKS